LYCRMLYNWGFFTIVTFMFICIVCSICPSGASGSQAEKLFSSLSLSFDLHTPLAMDEPTAQLGTGEYPASSSPYNGPETIVDEYEGVFLEINKATHRLHVYLNDHIIYSFAVATGRSKGHTPEGTFKIVSKIENPWYVPKNIEGGSPRNPLGTRWMGLNVPGTNGYKYGIHGTNNPASIGHSVSGGCIRMYNQDAEWLYEHIPLNTYVRIIDE
jgi:lipoprotein-anchoring transpeptidase ErfK/SrfK